MVKWRRWAIGVAALLVTGAFLMNASPGGAATKFSRGYWGPYRLVSSHRANTGKKGLSIGDQDIGGVRLYKNGKQRGVLYFDCAYTIVRHQRVRQFCRTDTDIYAHGQIIADGICHNISFLQPITGSRCVLLITGGGGDYRHHPKGTVTVKFRRKRMRAVYRVGG